jgi:membrane protein implicated in regulation of membrane protease activity
VPATVHHVEPRLFGVAPPATVGALGAFMLALAIVLLAVGHWLGGILLLALAVGLAALFRSALTRDRDSRLARLALGGAEAVGARCRFAGVWLSAWVGAGREVMRLQSEQWRLRVELRGKLARLGEAVYQARRGA